MTSPGCVPAGISTGMSPSSVGTSSVVPSAASGAVDVDHRVQVLAVADEALVLAHAHQHVEVAGGPAALARVPAPAEPDALAVA